jgi:cytochrome c biogenesis protein CcmG, thiol:disulfide interchange protein DsbE
MRRALIVIAALAFAAVIVIGLTQAGGSEEPQSAAQSFDLEAAKTQLGQAHGGLYADANRLLEGDGFERQLRDLEGTPVVINKWASWCGPCRSEFPIFQRVAADRGKQVAFLGLNAADARPAAEGFLAERPLPYPSYEDEEEALAQDLRAARYFPMTVFVEPSGDIAFVKAGEYRTEAELEADIDRYLGA